MRWMSLLQVCLTALLFWPFGQSVYASETDTLAAIRADLQTGSLRPLLSRQTIVNLPQSLQEKWLAEVRFETFAVTGFNQNSERYAARVRLHLAEGEGTDNIASVTFIRVAGTPGTQYTVDQFYDYATGLDLVSLRSQQAWLASRSGEMFMTTLSQDPGNPDLAKLAQGRAAPLALWLAQCSDKPCELAALQAQIDTGQPALWQLRKAFADNDRSAVDSQLSALRSALGDDPWFWQITGIYARHHQHCDWVVVPLQDAWKEQPNSRSLADSALQCSLAAIPQNVETLDARGTVFLDRLSEQLGPQRLSAAIKRYYQHQQRVTPGALSPWMSETTGE
ncbi:hypothetical protein [Alcanivorax sp. DP30]|uniref:hypothetical protein n=1 Tax=Alcanivorax sp. DP30 TaxID=2606217 RepID=UPI00136C7B4A|nr:hypothetical protein [Alcanivorax sp. DP30]MZR61809.1 hypothetical protein [Alcanivorax sp. DP30]